jgi:mRNA-degrading endonuclease RelE of RelBE toxin-antitoxin system
MRWQIQRGENFSKCLKDLDTIALNNFDREVRDLEKCDNPINNAEFVPTRKYGKCFTRRLTKSYRLAYRVFPNDVKIQLITSGDHKKIYGKDKRS